MLTRQSIADGLRALGLASGDRVLVHSSIAALGTIEGGPDAVIDALLDVAGPEGLVAVPTFVCSPPFDRKTSRTALGAIADTFWRRAETLRSLHPTHSLAAIGRGAEELLHGHEKAPTAYGEGTPYHTLAMNGGKVLLMGVDQDRNTTLHTAEALVNAPYLGTVEAAYVDDSGETVTLTVPLMAGPHRDFIGLDRAFRESGLMRVGKIGSAVCRLMDGRRMIEVAVEKLRQDPAAVLCDNPACGDCRKQRGQIKAARLAAEGFTLSALAEDIADDPERAAAILSDEGIRDVEISGEAFIRRRGSFEKAGLRIAAIRDTLANAEAVEAARKAGIPLIAAVSTEDEFRAAAVAAAQGTPVLVENCGAPSGMYEEWYANEPAAPGLAFNPGAFAEEGENPFLKVFYRGLLRKKLRHFYVDDRTSDGTPALPGRGNGEVKEILSMLRCRSYGGVVTLRAPQAGPEAFRETAAAFWKLLDEM